MLGKEFLASDVRFGELQERELIPLTIWSCVIARIIHDGPPPIRQAQGPEHIRGTKSRSRVASLPAESLSQQRIRDWSRSVHE